jgi:hypothetical protein
MFGVILGNDVCSLQVLMHLQLVDTHSSRLLPYAATCRRSKSPVFLVLICFRVRLCVVCAASAQ